MSCSHNILNISLRSAFLLLLLPLSGALNALATSRVQHRFDGTNGLTIPTVFSLAQDAEGFVWIGTVAGLVRFDGAEMRPWAKDIIKRDVSLIVTSSSGEVLVSESGGTLYRVTRDSVVAVEGPDGKPILEVRDATFDTAGHLWVLNGTDQFHWRDTKNVWHRVDSGSIFSGERVRRLRPGTVGSVYVLTDKAVWRTDAGANPHKLLDTLRPLDVVDHPNGSVYVLTWWMKGEVIEIPPGQKPFVRASLAARAIDLTLRGDVVWASFDRYLVSVAADHRVVTIGPEDDLPSGGPLLVDHENGLWVGTFTGLIQYPEPETVIWKQNDGLSTNHTRYLGIGKDGVWVTTWGWMGLIGRDGRAHTLEGIGSRIPCVDSAGMLWAYRPGVGIVRHADGNFIKQLTLNTDRLHMCARGDNGTLWLATLSGLYRVSEDGGLAQKISFPAGDNPPGPVISVIQDRTGRIWASSSDGRICSANTGAINGGNLAEWSCQLIDPHTDIVSLQEVPSGDIWAATNQSGLWRYHAGKWEPHPASATLPSQGLFSLRDSPSGGVWVMGHGISMRVVEQPELAPGWRILEQLSLWQGLHGDGGGDIAEDANGTLWLTTSDGVVQVPKEARRVQTEPPRVRLATVFLDGRLLSNIDDSPELAHGGQVELRFAALSFRDRSRLRYQYRLKPDAPWIDSRDTAPVLRFVNLGAGRYAAEVRASLDGENWSTTPARFAFQVRKPWYLQTWALIIFALTMIVVLYAIHRARIAMLLRLEHQRAQIARDLHDEMGSGLGSIGILSGLAAENNMNAAEHQELARKIADTAGELGTTLTEIVWA